MGARDRQGQLGDGVGTQMEEEPGVACLGEKQIVGGRQSETREHLRAQWASVIFSFRFL